MNTSIIFYLYEMSVRGFKTEKDIDVLGLSLKKLSLFPNLSRSSFHKEHCDNKEYVEHPKSGLSLSHCTKSDIVKRLCMRTREVTIIQLNDVHLLSSLNTSSESKEDSKDNRNIIDVTTFFSELTVSCKKSDYIEDDENKVATNIQKRGKFPPIHPNSQVTNVCPYHFNRPHHNEGFNKNLLHWSGGTVSYPDSNNTHPISDPINIYTDTEVISEGSPNAASEYRCTSPESGYGSPGSVSNLCLPNLAPTTTITEFLPSKCLEDVLNVQKNIPYEETDEILDDIVQLISEDRVKNSNSNCEAKVTIVAPIYIFNVINSTPPTKMKQLRTICPKPSTTLPMPSTSRPTPSTSRPTPSTTRPTTSTTRPTTSTPCPTPLTSHPTPSTSRHTSSTSRFLLSTIRPKSNTDVTEENNWRNLLKCHLNHNEIERIASDIYLRKREEKQGNEKKVIFVEDLKTKRTNLHMAVIKGELEHVYCLIEVQIQFSQEWKDVAVAFNLVDTAHKTALDYANELKIEQKSAVVAYLEKVGAKPRLKKKRAK